MDYTVPLPVRVKKNRTARCDEGVPLGARVKKNRTARCNKDAQVMMAPLEQDPKILKKYNLTVGKSGVVKKDTGRMSCKTCKWRMIDRLRQGVNRSACVDRARKLGFAIENRQTKESQPLCLCPYCGAMSSESMSVHAHRHKAEGIDANRLITYCNAVFSGNARGPVSLPKLKNDIKMAVMKNDGSLDEVLRNVLHSVGVGTTDSKCKSMPSYNMKTLFNKNTPIPQSHMNAVLDQGYVELNSTEDDDSDADS